MDATTADVGLQRLTFTRKPDGWLTRLLQLVVYWPIGYLVLSPLERQWHGRVRPIFNEPRWRKGNST